jgi:hypothetical protein
MPLRLNAIRWKQRTDFSLPLPEVEFDELVETVGKHIAPALNLRSWGLAPSRTKPSIEVRPRPTPPGPTKTLVDF